MKIIIQLLILLLFNSYISFGSTARFIPSVAFENKSPNAEIDAGPNRTVCGDEVQLEGKVSGEKDGEISWVTTGKGTFSPNSSSLNAIYKRAASDPFVVEFVLQYTKKDKIIPLPEIDNVTIIFTSGPTVNAGPDQVVCGTNNSIRLQGIVTKDAIEYSWSGGAGKFGDPSSLSTTYQASEKEIESGSVKLTLTAKNLICQNTSTTTIYFSSNSVNSGENYTSCGDVPVALKGTSSDPTAAVTWSGGKGKFSDPSALNTTYTPTAAEIKAGTVTVNLSTDATSCKSTSDAVITFSPAAIVNSGENYTSCGDVPVALKGTSTDPTAAVTWSGGKGKFSDPSALNTTYTPTAAEIKAGTVTVNLSTDATSCKSTSDAVITFSPAAIVNSGENYTSCGDVPVALKGTSTDPTAAVTWSGGKGKFSDPSALNTTYTPTAAEIKAGTVTVNLSTDGNSCKSTSDAVITFNTGSTVNSGEKYSTCGSTVALKGTSSDATVAVSWSGGNGKFSDPSALNTTYTPTAAEIKAGTVTVNLSTDATSCKSTSDAVITFNTGATVNSGEKYSTCGSTVALKGTSTDPTAAVTWSGGNGKFSDPSALNTTYTPTAAEIKAGTVTVNLSSDATSCKSTSDAVITFSPAAIVNSGEKYTSCGDAPIALKGTSTDPTAAVTWSGGKGKFSDPSALNTTYTPTAAEIKAGTVTVNLSTDAISCKSTSDAVITFTSGATVNSGEKYTSCGSTVALKGTSTDPTAAVTWSGGNGKFSDPSALNTTYTPTAAEIKAGTVTVNLSTDATSCKSTSDAVITFNTGATVNSGEKYSTCGSTVALKGTSTDPTAAVTWSGGKGKFSDPSALNTTYTPTAAEIKAGTVTVNLSTDATSCKSTSDAVITFSPAAIVNSGEKYTTCGSTVALKGTSTDPTAAVTWSGGNGKFSDPSALNTTYTPTAAEIKAGTVTVNLSTAGTSCKSTSDAVITFNTGSTVNSGEKYSTCGSTVALKGTSSDATAAVTWSGGNGKFSDPSALNTTYTPTAAEIKAGTVTVNLSTDGISCKSTSDAVITFTSGAIVNSGEKYTSCGDAPIALKGTSTVPSAAVTWSGGNGKFSDPSALNTTYTPTAAEIKAGTVTVNLSTAGTSCKSTSDAVITFTSGAIVNSGEKYTSCGDAPIALKGTSTVPTAAVTWSGGNGKFSDPSALNTTYTPTAAEIKAGTVTVNLSTDRNSCKSTSDAVITFTSGAIVKSGEKYTSCGDAPIALKGTSTDPTAAVTWSGGNGKFSDPSALNTTYTPTAAEIKVGTLTVNLSTAGTSCKSTSDAVITFTPGAIVNSGEKYTTCGSTAALKGTSTDPTAAVTWSGGNGKFSDPSALNTTYTPTAAEIKAGTVTVNLSTDGTTCKSTSDAVITFSPAAIVNSGEKYTTCGSTVALKGTSTDPTDAVTWSGGNGKFSDPSALNTTYTPTAAEIKAGTVILNLSTIGDACQSTSEANITFSEGPLVNSGEQYAVCGNQVSLIGTSNSDQSTVLWSGGKGIFKDPSALKTIYTATSDEVNAGLVLLNLSITNNQCKSNSNAVVSFNKSTTINAGSDISICPGTDHINLKGTTNSGLQTKWTTNGDGNFSPSDTSLNVFYILGNLDKSQDSLQFILTAASSCGTISDNLTLKINKKSVNAGKDITVCKNNLPINLQGTTTSNNSNFNWTSTGTGIFKPSTNDLNTTYIPSVNDHSKGKIIIILRSDISECKNNIDSLIINFINKSNVSAGIDIETCSGNSISINGKTSITNTPVQWLSNGSGTFLNDKKLSTSYTPSSKDVEIGIVNIVLSTSAEGNCGLLSDTLLLIIRPTISPILDTVKDKIFCSGQKINLTETTQGNFKYTWELDKNNVGNTNRTSGILEINNPSSFDSDFYIHNSTNKDSLLYLVLHVVDLNSLCSTSKKIKYTILPSITAYAGKDTTICSSDRLTLGSPSNIGVNYYWTPSEYLSNTKVSNPKIKSENKEVIQNLTFNVTASLDKNSNCKSSDTIKVTILPNPLVNAGKDTTICFSSQLKLGSTTKSLDHFKWKPSNNLSNDSISNPNFKIKRKSDTTHLITYSLTQKNKFGCISKDTILIHILPASTSIESNDSMNIFCGNSFIGNYEINPLAGSNFKWQVTGGKIIENSPIEKIKIDWDTTIKKELIAIETTKDGCKNEIRFNVDERESSILINMVTKDLADPLNNIIKWKFSSSNLKPDYVNISRNPSFSGDVDSIKILSHNGLFDSIFVDKNINPLLIYNYTFTFKNKCNTEVKSLTHHNMLLKAERDMEGIHLNWNEYQNWISGVSTYELWYKDPENDSTYIFQQNINSTSVNLNNINIKNESTYCYRIKAINSEDANYSWSNESCINSSLIIPNAISPNGDKVNDFWIINNANSDNLVAVTVFNQWNSEVYSNHNYQNDWNGNGLPDGVYYYTIKVAESQLKGYILINR